MAIYEKHFTLDKDLPGPDQKASMTPNELRDLIIKIRLAERADGTGIKHMLWAESNTRDVARKSIVASRTILAGERITDDSITMTRPGTGLRYSQRRYVLDKTALRAIQADELISLEDLV